MILFQLFLSFFQIGLFSFGGGYAALPLIQNQVVNVHGWLTITELSDLITISQMTPGPIAINAATFVGNKVGGMLGSFIATIGCILPSCIIVTILAYLYIKYRHLDFLKIVLRTLRPCVVALIATAGLSILLTAFFPTQNISYIMIFIFLISLLLLRIKKINPITVMVLAGVLNIIIAS